MRSLYCIKQNTESLTYVRFLCRTYMQLTTSVAVEAVVPVLYRATSVNGAHVHDD